MSLRTNGELEKYVPGSDVMCCMLRYDAASRALAVLLQKYCFAHRDDRLLGNSGGATQASWFPSPHRLKCSRFEALETPLSAHVLFRWNFHSSFLLPLHLGPDLKAPVQGFTSLHPLACERSELFS